MIYNKRKTLKQPNSNGLMIEINPEKGEPFNYNHKWKRNLILSEKFVDYCQYKNLLNLELFYKKVLTNEINNETLNNIASSFVQSSTYDLKKEKLKTNPNFSNFKLHYKVKFKNNLLAYYAFNLVFYLSDFSLGNIPLTISLKDNAITIETDDQFGYCDRKINKDEQYYNDLKQKLKILERNIAESFLLLLTLTNLYRHEKNSCDKIAKNFNLDALFKEKTLISIKNEIKKTNLGIPRSNYLEKYFSKYIPEKNISLIRNI